MEQVRVRIAPSPTGPLHIGTARTALINFIFARQNKGQFLVRIEDTDKKRDKAEFVTDILDGLNWLGLNSDESVVYQSIRGEVYQQAIETLLRQGNAYEKEKAVWFKIPDSSARIEFSDLIRGQVSFAARDLKDFVIRRSDGSPIFYLSGVVDDQAMRVSHVIRGEDHLSNTPKQILLCQALKYTIPIYAHVPLILNANRSKMSKRADPVSLNRDFRAQGYLPQALINFLALLGWHPAQNRPTDFYTLAELIETFHLEEMQKGGAIFDPIKLDSLNHHYLAQKNSLELLKLLTDGGFVDSANLDLIGKAVYIVKDRLVKLADFPNLTEYIFSAPQPKAVDLPFRQSTPQRAKLALEKITVQLGKTDFKSAVSLKSSLETLVGQDGLTSGDIFWTTRVALTGLRQSPPPEDVMWALGQAESLERIKQASNRL